ncbi:hypothetical protein KKE74_03565 [Patescibacteria group bacterium]|nr:hypothetical protein [Patescibacteria group bacterium]MBU2473083.1 hypothetical protein [Patescibacteria group bacterium]
MKGGHCFSCHYHKKEPPKIPNPDNIPLLDLLKEPKKSDKFQKKNFAPNLPIG